MNKAVSREDSPRPPLWGVWGSQRGPENGLKIPRVTNRTSDWSQKAWPGDVRRSQRFVNLRHGGSLSGHVWQAHQISECAKTGQGHQRVHRSSLQHGFGRLVLVLGNLDLPWNLDWPSCPDLLVSIGRGLLHVLRCFWCTCFQLSPFRVARSLRCLESKSKAFVCYCQPVPCLRILRPGHPKNMRRHRYADHFSLYLPLKIFIPPSPLPLLCPLHLLFVEYAISPSLHCAKFKKHVLSKCDLCINSWLVKCQ